MGTWMSVYESFMLWQSRAAFALQQANWQQGLDHM